MSSIVSGTVLAPPMLQPVVSASISSISSAVLRPRVSPSYLSETYNRGSELFLTRRLPEALSTVLPLVTPGLLEIHGESESFQSSTSHFLRQKSLTALPSSSEPAPITAASRKLRIKIWTLYISILNAIIELELADGKADFGTQEWRAICSHVRDGDIWEDVVKYGYNGVEGDVDIDVVVNLSTLLLSHACSQTLNQQRIESFLAASSHYSPTQNTTHSSSSDLTHHTHDSSTRVSPDDPRHLEARLKLLEIYTLHILRCNGEWDYARDFITASTVLDEERRDAFLQALQSFYNQHVEDTRQAELEKERQKEELQRDLEEARRLRDEHEELERQRVEAVRARVESVTDDDEPKTGDRKKGPAGTSKAAASQPSAAPTSPTDRARKPTRGAKDMAGAGVRSLSLVLGNLRLVIGHIVASMHTNPAALLRLLAFTCGLVLMLGRKEFRERVLRVIRTAWNKIMATAGMGVKVTYI